MISIGKAQKLLIRSDFCTNDVSTRKCYIQLQKTGLNLTQSDIEFLYHSYISIIYTNLNCAPFLFLLALSLIYVDNTVHFTYQLIHCVLSFDSCMLIVTIFGTNLYRTIWTICRSFCPSILIIFWFCYTECINFSL